jgi:uncharacterized protein (DUF849 family)
MEKLIITAALTGNITLPTQTPYLPITPQQIIDDAVRAADAGAASVHIHARDPKNCQTDHRAGSIQRDRRWHQGQE